MTTRPNEPKRLGRSSEASQLRRKLFDGECGHRVGVYVWPDARELLESEAANSGLTLSGMAHRILRAHYNLPPIP